jgi:hypothetical protein
VIGAAAARSEFARSVLDRHRRAAFADRPPLVLATVRDAGTSATIGRERVREVTVRERWATPVWAPRIDVHLQALPQRFASPGRPALPADPLTRILERVVRNDGTAIPGVSGMVAAAQARENKPSLVLSQSPRVERILVRDRASTPQSREPVTPARPQTPVVEPPRRSEPRFTDTDVAQLTDRVMRSIDQRLRAYRERLGRA